MTQLLLPSNAHNSGYRALQELSVEVDISKVYGASVDMYESIYIVELSYIVCIQTLIKNMPEDLKMFEDTK